ncbi:MAG: antibiotic biosynthesis monooxygenase [Planctomycetes bacterium]|nr:antibiotic biosynthesis monooxygenase [Planctomycetota bacterium]
MAIKVAIIRKVPQQASQELRPLLLKLRGMAMVQPGYISGETLVNMDDPEQFLVLSSWDSVETWDSWLKDNTRNELQKEIDDLIGTPTMYQVYLHG